MILNFKQDWIEILRTELASKGFSSNPTIDFDTICIQYFNLKRRLIPQQKRKVLISNEFSCPPSVANGLELLKGKIENGENLTPHLSTLLQNINYNDSMLNDWGIYHLHLGERMLASGFMERSDPLLYARFDHNNFYFVNVYDHNNWTKKEIIRILHDNWPESIKNYKLNGIIRLRHNLNEQEIKHARNAKLNTMVELDEGVVYAPLGGGLTTAGTSIEVMQQVNMTHRVLNAYETHTRDNLDKFTEEATRQKITMPEAFHFKLEIDGDQVYAVEQSTKLALELGGFRGGL